MTWNVLSERLDPVHRGQAIRDHLLAVNADIIALQEVAPWLLQQIRQDRRFSPWRQTVIGGEVRAPGGCFILSRWPMRNEVVLVPSRQDRIVLMADIAHPRGNIRVATMHWDSPLGEAWQQVRIQQMQETQRSLGINPTTLVLGDANFGVDDPEQQHVPLTWMDTWKVLYPDKPGLTWDRVLNHMADGNSFPSEPSRRIDRCWLTSPLWTPVEAGLTGQLPYDQEGLLPSDHFGLWVRLVAPDAE